MPTNPLPPIGDRPVVTLVAPLWQDLVPIKGSSQNVFWGVAGNAPNRQLVIEWRDVRTYECRDDANATVRFEVVFSKSSNSFQFNYSDVIFGGACSNQDFGNRATVGMQVTQDTGLYGEIRRRTIAKINNPEATRTKGFGSGTRLRSSETLNTLPPPFSYPAELSYAVAWT